VKLKVLSTALILIAVGCSSLRLFPARWSRRKFPLCQRTVTCFWSRFSCAGCVVRPLCDALRRPAIDHRQQAEFPILQVQKRGMRFYETAVNKYRNGRVWVLRNDTPGQADSNRAKIALYSFLTGLGAVIGDHNLGAAIPGS
jgi:hypothetical protein